MSSVEQTVTLDTGDVELTDEAKRRLEALLKAAIESEVETQPNPQSITITVKIVIR